MFEDINLYKMGLVGGCMATKSDAEQIKEGHKRTSKEDVKKGIDIPYPK